MTLPNSPPRKKSILITGCSSGIGLCAAQTLHQRGYRVIAGVRKASDIPRLQALGLPHVIELDLRDSTSIDNAVAAVLEITGGELYALFNNGAYGQPGAVEDLSRDALREQFETNLFGTHELTIKLLPTFLRQDDARIVQNSSILGFTAMPMRGAYNASKFALEGLTDTLRLELLDTPVKVSLIEPGPILSHFRQNALVALQQNINIDGSRHHELYRKGLERLKKEGATSRFTLPPEAVVDKLIHSLESKNPRRRYFVTFPTYLMAVLKVILPGRWMDQLVFRAGQS